MVYKYKISDHSVYNISYHIVFCPKRRKPVLVDDIVTDLEAKFTEIINNLGGKIESLSIQQDYIHIFVSIPPNISPHIIVKKLKGGTSKFLRDKYKQLRRIPTMWSRSYYVGTIGFVSESIIKNYINNQKKS